MNSSVWAVWAAQSSKEKLNKFEYFLTTFDGDFFDISWAILFHKNIVASAKVIHPH